MYLTCLFTTKTLHVQSRAQSLPSTQDAASLFTHKSPPPKRSPTSVRALEHSSRRSSVHVLSARRSHTSDTRPAVRLHHISLCATGSGQLLLQPGRGGWRPCAPSAPRPWRSPPSAAVRCASAAPICRDVAPPSPAPSRWRARRLCRMSPPRPAGSQRRLSLLSASSRSADSFSSAAARPTASLSRRPFSSRSCLSAVCSSLSRSASSCKRSLTVSPAASSTGNCFESVWRSAGGQLVPPGLWSGAASCCALQRQRHRARS